MTEQIRKADLKQRDSVCNSDDLVKVAVDAAKMLRACKGSATGQSFQVLAQMRTCIRDKLETYLKDAINDTKFVSLLEETNKAFKKELHQNDDYMDVDEFKQEQDLINQEFGQSLIDAIWLHKCKLDENQGKEFHNKIQIILNRLQESGVLQKSKLLASLELTSLGALGLVKEQFFAQRVRLYYTQTYFEQQKFNLLREENEGFAKLLLEINQENLNESNQAIVIENIQKLIGYFSLDPNRVLDLLLSAFQSNLSNLSYIAMLKEFGTQHAVTQLIGFKFQSLSDREEKHLFDLTALLIKYEVVDLVDIWSHLQSQVENEKQEDQIERLLQQQGESLKYQYSMLFKTIMDNQRFEEEMKGKRLEQIQIDETRLKMPQNPKLRLLQSCLDMNDWVTADEICNGVYQGKLDFTLSKDLLSSFFRAIQWFVEPLYKMIEVTASFQTVWGSLKASSKTKSYYEDALHPSSLKQAKTVEILFSELQRILRVINLYIAFDEALLLKLLKVILHSVQQHQEYQQLAANLCGEYFIPALTLTSENYQLEQLTWQIFKYADFKQRYASYSKLLQRTYLSYPCLLAKLIMVYRESTMWARRLNTDQMRQMSKQLSKIASGNALIVFDLIVSNAKAYDNMIEAQIQSMANCQDLSLDMMAFTITKHFADANELMLDDEGNVQQWLNYLTKFATSFFKKFHQVEILGLLTFLLHRQREEGNFLLGYVLNQLIAKMFGWNDQIINQVPANQLNVIAAGFVLMLEGKGQSKEVRKNNKSTEALIKLFWDVPTNGHEKFAMRLIIQLAQYTQHVQTQMDNNGKLIMVSRLYDRVQIYFLHLVDSLNFLASGEKKFALLLTDKPAKTLSFDYRLPPQYVFQILRCSLPPIHKLKNEQFNEYVQEFRKVLEYNLQSRLEIAQNSQNAIDNDYWDEIKFIQLRKDDLWKCLRPEIYFIFWYMSIQNLVVCDSSYKEEVKRIGDQIDELKTSKPAASTDTKILSSSEQQKKNNKEIERQNKIQKTLQNEQEFLSKHQQATFEYLKIKLPLLFEEQAKEQGNENQGINDATNSFLQYCLYPRILHSAKDALYSFHFFKILHKLRVPSFKILKFLIAILKCVMPAMHCCSEGEAENLGIFFLELFGLLNHWSKKSVWEKECVGYVGFAKNFGSDQCISHEEFVEKISESINKRFAVKMLCLEPSTKMYMKTRCSLIILNRMSPVFPNSFKNAEAIALRLQALVDMKDTLSQDLWTLAFRCNESLKTKMQTFPEYIKEQQQRELLAKQAEDAAKLKEKLAKPSDRPSTKDVRNEGTSNRAVQEKNGKSSTQELQKSSKDVKKEDLKPTQTPVKSTKNLESSKSESKQTGKDQSIRHVSTSNSSKPVKKEDHASGSKLQTTSQRAIEVEKKTSNSTPSQKQTATKDVKPQSQPSTRMKSPERQGDLFPNGQASKAKVKADEKQQQSQSKVIAQTVDRTKPQANGTKKEVSPVPNQVSQKSHASERTIEQRKSVQEDSKPRVSTAQTISGKSDSKVLTIQPRSSTDEIRSVIASHPLEQLDFVEPKIEKRPRIEVSQKIEEPKHRSEFVNQDLKMNEQDKLKDQHFVREQRATPDAKQQKQERVYMTGDQKLNVKNEKEQRYDQRPVEFQEREQPWQQQRQARRSPPDEYYQDSYNIYDQSRSANFDKTQSYNQFPPAHKQPFMKSAISDRERGFQDDKWDVFPRRDFQDDRKRPDLKQRPQSPPRQNNQGPRDDQYRAVNSTNRNQYAGQRNPRGR